MKAPKCRLCNKEHWGRCELAVDHKLPRSPRSSPPARVHGGRTGAGPVVVAPSIGPAPKYPIKEFTTPGWISTELTTADLAKAMLAPNKKTKRRARRKGGRPPKGQEDKTNEAKQPWKAEGVSRRTWYRRQAK